MRSAVLVLMAMVTLWGCGATPQDIEELKKNQKDILAKLETAGLAPAPQAEKRTLIRRATFDLLGLPPTPEEIATFVADKSPDAFAQFRPQLSAGLLARVHFPTGAYNRDQPVNFGANRYSFQLGLPTGVILGQSYRDPRLTTLELLPAVTFYGVNSHPYGAARVTKAAQFSLESHLTHNLGPAVWVSADMLYRNGGETTTEAGRTTTRRAAGRRG